MRTGPVAPQAGEDLGTAAPAQAAASQQQFLSVKQEHRSLESSGVCLIQVFKKNLKTQFFAS